MDRNSDFRIVFPSGGFVTIVHLGGPRWRQFREDDYCDWTAEEVLRVLYGALSRGHRIIPMDRERAVQIAARGGDDISLGDKD
jgi:hypothetical protein